MQKLSDLPPTAVYVCTGDQLELVNRDNIQEMVNLLAHRMKQFQNAMFRFSDAERRQFGSMLRNEMLDCRFWIEHEAGSMSSRSELRERFEAAADYLVDAAACVYDMAYENNRWVDLPVYQSSQHSIDWKRQNEEVQDQVNVLTVAVLAAIATLVALDHATGSNVSGSVHDTIKEGIKSMQVDSDSVVGDQKEVLVEDEK